jgi:hypothetical protein
MSRVRYFRLAVGLTIYAILATTVTVAQAESREEEAAKELIEAEKELILFFAHPTAEYRSVRCSGTKSLTDGFTLSYTFSWHSPISDKGHHTDLTFYFDANGKCDFIQPGSTSSLFPPFSGSNLVVKVIKTELQKDPDLQNDRQLMKLLQKDSKAILESYLQRDVESLMTLMRSLAAASSK